MSQENDRQLPDGWQWVKLGDVCEIINGYAFKSSQFTTDGVPVIKMGNISKDFALKINLNQQSYIAKNIANLYQDFYIYPNDLLITLTDMSPSGEYLGTVAIYNLAKPALLNQRVGKFINLDQEILDNNFLYYTLRSKDFRKYATLDDTGNLQKNTNPKYLYEYLIPLPPLSEQKRIAAILNEQMEAVEKARKATEAQLEAAKALPAAYLRAVFESEEANSWERRKLGDIAKLERGKFTPRPRNDPRYYGGDYPWIQTGEVESANKYITAYNTTLNADGLAVSKLFPKGTLVITIAATIGAVGILDFDSCMPDSLVGITPYLEASNTDFIYYSLLFIREHLKSIAPQVAQANLKLSILQPLEISLPSLAKQQQIASTLTEQMQEVERLKQNLKEQLDTINKLPAVLLRRAFKGEL
ncbi:restriction endonuclease subunit S [Microcystis aeruginosa CS-558/01A06]|uniref:Restriction endonuclease subunit S n=2 Tax=Microcystis TaxID=1125 RepID=A0A841UFV0_MICAE|nr:MULTISPECIES: restriction endonuclease subunit S [Microcystis]MBC1189801.1 restriction endonuclease subunit S [Microcystis aeruginosa BLCC-F108]MCA2590131.1 restriction endonuclease subunit S [Microcystis sp. M31BS1]MDB9410340.1 restriction endonuclease subunit S [Microcystis aeruginosa CS-558/01A06]